MKITSFFTFLIILTSIAVATPEHNDAKKRNYIKIPKEIDGFTRERLRQFIDAIILYNRSVFGEKKCHETNWASVQDRFDDKKYFFKNQYHKIFDEAGMYIDSKEQYEKSYSHLKTSEERAAEKIAKMQFPKNPKYYVDLSDEEITNCKKCIDLLKAYTRNVQFILSEENTLKGSYPHSTDRKVYYDTAFIYSDYKKEQCPQIFEKINFEEQIEKASNTPFSKIFKAFELFQNSYRGLINPFTWLKK